MKSAKWVVKPHIILGFLCAVISAEWETARAADTPEEEKVSVARQYISERLAEAVPNLGNHDRIVLIADGSFDPEVTKLVRDVVRESGARFETILLEGAGDETDPAKLQILLWCIDPDQMWPEWIWGALEGATAVISAYGPDVHNMTDAHREWFASRGIKRLRFWHATMGTVLVDALEQGIGYPQKILDTLEEVTRKNLASAKRVHITDPNGTDFQFSMTKHGRPHDDAEGQLVAYAMHGGLIPKTILHLKGGKVVRVEGKGALADQMSWIIENMDQLTFPKASAPGGSFLVEVDLHTVHPKITRPPWKGLRGAAKYFAFSKGYKRAGVLTVGFGTPTAVAGSEVVAFAKEKGVTLQHLDTHLYHATVTLDGREFISNGRPLALDHPKVRSVAAEFGDPDELLSLDWVPSLDGRSP